MENVKENEAQKEQVLSNEEHHLLDLFAPINRWTQREGHHALVFLCDGKNSLMFCNEHRIEKKRREEKSGGALGAGVVQRPTPRPP